MNARAKRIRAAAYDLEDDDDLLEAIACMIEAATAKESKRKKVAEADKLPVGPALFIERFKADVGDKIICDPILGSWYGRLGGILKNWEPKFELADLDLVIDWIKAGGTKSWNTGMPTFENAMYMLPKWLGWAREWDRRGRGELGKKDTVGAPTGADAMWSSFKPK